VLFAAALAASASAEAGLRFRATARISAIVNSAVDSVGASGVLRTHTPRSVAEGTSMLS